MKIGRIATAGGVHLGAVAIVDGLEMCLDLTAANARLGHVPADALGSMGAFIRGGQRALVGGYNLIAWASESGDHRWFTSLDQVRWLPPVEPPLSFLCAGRNFNKHRVESAAKWAKEGIDIATATFPVGFIKLCSTIVGNGDQVARPAGIATMDYEVEIAAIIGKDVLNIDRDAALPSVFGYTAFNDLSAREIQRQEMRNQMLLLGKNFPGFSPIGPWILTADEVPDPSRLTMELRVNGEVRQQASAADMIFDFADLIAFWSRAGLKPGDVIASGTPDGIASSRLPDPAPFFLKPGDHVETIVHAVGTLQSYII